MGRPSSPCSISYKSLIPWVVLFLCTGGGIALAKLSLSVSPPLIEATLVPGGVRRITVAVTNEGDEDAQVTLRLLPFGLSPEGEVVFLNESPYSLLPFMTTREKDVFILRAKEKKEIPFELRTPRGEKGGRYGVILFEALPLNIPSGMAVGIRMGTLILATFPRSSGPKGKIQTVREKDGKIEVEVENTGDVHFAVTEGEAVLKTKAGKILKRVNLTGTGLLLPGGMRLLSGELREGFEAPGPCTLEARVYTRKGNRRLLLDRMSVPYPITGGEEKEENMDVSVEVLPGNKNK